MGYGLATVAVNGREAAVAVRDGRIVPLSHWGEERALPELIG